MALVIAFTLVFLALIGYGLQRNARRQTGPTPPLAGSTDVPDRDLQRVRAELAALNGPASTPRDGSGARADRRRAHGRIVALH